MLLASQYPQKTPRLWKHRAISFMFWGLIWRLLSRTSANSPQSTSVRQQAAQLCFIQAVGCHDVLQLLSVSFQVLHEVGHSGIIQHDAVQKREANITNVNFDDISN